MKMKNTLIRRIIAVTKSKWLRPSLTALALLAAVFVATGCDGSRDSDHRDSDHHMNHDNHGDHRN